MKRFLIVLFFLSGVKLVSQDQLFKKDNSKQEVKVLEVTPDEIKYKLKVNPNGPLYTIKKSDVALVIYENGTHETYPESKSQTQTVYVEQRPYYTFDSSAIYKDRTREKQFLSFTKAKNVAFINIVDVLNSSISLSYFREFGNGLFDIHVPFSFSFAEPAFQSFFGSYNPGNYSGITNFKITQKAYDFGLGFYINTSGRRVVTHFIGPLVRFVQYNGTFQAYDNNTYYYNSYVNYQLHGFVVNETICMLNTGVLFRVTPRFNIKINAALGFVTARHFVANDPATFQNNSNNNYYTTNNYATSFLAGFHFGYRF